MVQRGIRQAWADRQLLQAARKQVGVPTSNPHRSRLESPASVHALIDRAAEHSAIGLLYRAASAPDYNAPPGFRELIRKAYAKQLAHNHYVLAQLQELMSVVEGIDVLVVKGIALASQHYGDPGIRPTADIDIVCRQDQTALIADRLARIGYIPKPDFREKLDLYCHATLEKPSEAGVPLELHWSLGRNFPSHPKDDLLWEGTGSIKVGGQAVVTLSLENQLLLSCLHLIHHCVFGWHPSILWLTDVAMIAQHEQLDWARLAQLTTQQQYNRAVFLALVLAQRLLDAKIPSEIFRQMANSSRVLDSLAERGLLDALPVRGLPVPVRHLVASSFQGDLTRRGRYLGKQWIKPALVRMGLWESAARNQRLAVKEPKK